MNRLTLTLAAWAMMISTTHASLTPVKNSVALGRLPAVELTTPVAAVTSTLGRKGNAEYTLTANTEILLDGKPCKYADVPSRASIERMELATDKKTVVRIHFRTNK